MKSRFNERQQTRPDDNDSKQLRFKPDTTAADTLRAAAKYSPRFDPQRCDTFRQFPKMTRLSLTLRVDRVAMIVAVVAITGVIQRTRGDEFP